MSVLALVERLAPLIESELNLVINSEQEADSLSDKLEKIQEVLQEAERRGVTENGVKGWLKDLQVVTNEMDDVLDELEAAKLQVEVQDTSLNWDQVRSLHVPLCLCFKQWRSRREITLSMKALSVRIDTILTDKDRYGLVPSGNDRAHEFRQQESISLDSVEFKPYGLEDAMNSLLEKLVPRGGEGSDKATQVMSIVGLGGLGKSTLARVAYNHPEVANGHFDPIGWVSVSQAFDAKAIAKAILEAFRVKSDGANNLDTLAHNIKNTVNNKRFLLVLDNVWTKDLYEWESLKNCLDGVKGSRIVVTTRNEIVARMMGTARANMQFLDFLSDSDCGEILNGIALEGRTEEECTSLRGMGMEMAKRCYGLPLAAKSTGSLLKLKNSIDEWEKVLQSPLWKHGDGMSNLYRLLNLSYTDLSPLLKRCFLTCAIFPKGTLISIDEISRVWMAYGYLNSKGSVDDVQSKVFDNLNELDMRSFFQKVAIDKVSYWSQDRKSYTMHDVMHGLAKFLLESDEYSFIRAGGLEKDESSSPSSSHNNNLPSNYLGKLRTYCVSTEKFDPDIFAHLTSVRVLSVSDCSLKSLPENVGKLIHLRYLNVSSNPITQLPETITDLCHLQTLDITSCKSLSSLPEGIGKLINLRHLVNSNAFKMVEYPRGLGKLSNLWTLNEFRGSNLGCLKELNNLQGSLLLYLRNLNESEVGKPELCKKKHLKKLVLIFRKDREEREVVEALELPPCLESLAIHSGQGKWLSSWFHKSSFDKLNMTSFPPSFHKLKTVSLHGCGRHGDVPPFGRLPALEELEIFFCRFRRLSIDFLGLDQDASGQVVGGFPKLRKLCFIGCARWQEWEDIKEESVDIMGCLKELRIQKCPKLNVWPHNLVGKFFASTG